MRIYIVILLFIPDDVAVNSEQTSTSDGFDGGTVCRGEQESQPATIGKTIPI